MPQGLPALTNTPASGGVAPLVHVVSATPKDRDANPAETKQDKKPKNLVSFPVDFAKNAQTLDEQQTQPRGASTTKLGCWFRFPFQVAKTGKVFCGPA